jgi:hypothetical protein
MWTSDLIALHLELVEAYSSQSDIIRLAKQANLRTSFITWQGQAMNDWFSVLEAADKQNKLEQLLFIVKNEGLVNSLAEKNLLNIDMVSALPKNVDRLDLKDKGTIKFSIIIGLISEDKLEDAVQLLNPILENFPKDIKIEIINFSGRLTNLNKIQRGNLIDFKDYLIERNKIRNDLIKFINTLNIK